MSISIVITIMTMVIVGNYGAYEKDRVLRLLDVPRHFRQTKEPRGYIEQCRATNLRKEQLGHVNVFAFLDPSWYYSYRQAVMLGLLKKRLEKSGFSNILFFTVTPPSDLLEDSTENNIEIKAWREISKNTQEFEYSLDSVETLFGDIKEKRKGITLLQDTSELGIWKSFHASKDEVVIIDRCGKVTYQIIVPWSILHFPYVKAAILSTYKDDPCGPCYGQSSTIGDSMDYEEYLLKTINSDETKIDEDLDTQTDKVFSDLETIKTSSEELKQIEDDKNTSTIASFSANIHESMVYDITTKASMVRPTENMRNDDNVRDIFFTDKNIEITSEVPLEQEQTPIPTITSNFTTTEVYSEKQDCIFSNKHVNSNNDVSFTNTDLRRHDKDLQNESNISLEEMKMKEHEAIKESTKAKELQSLNDESIPLRIILYAPHLHEENATLKKYTHLVLNTGSLNYHDHFNSKSTTSDQEPPALKKSDSAILNDRTLAQYVDNVNESPGVYGEIADYWQTVDGNEISNKNENAELTDYDYVTTEDTGSNINNAFNNKSSILRPSDIDAIDSDMNIKNSNDLDDFTQQRLIDHYNKLLTWIYYIV